MLTEVRTTRKRETTWVGYKVHFSETCDQNPGRPYVDQEDASGFTDRVINRALQ